MTASAAIVISDDDEEVGEKSKRQAAMEQPSGGSDCVICYEPYDEDGEHKPAVLKCGHHAGEPCLRKWLKGSKVCPVCRKQARTRDLVVVFNLPTVLAAGGAASAPPPAAQPSELAEKELMVQKMQRKCIESEKTALREAEARKQVERKAEREAEARAESEREAKRLRQELEEFKRQLAALERAATTQPPPPPRQPHPQLQPQSQPPLPLQHQTDPYAQPHQQMQQQHVTHQPSYNAHAQAGQLYGPPPHAFATGGYPPLGGPAPVQHHLPQGPWPPPNHHGQLGTGAHQPQPPHQHLQPPPPSQPYPTHSHWPQAPPHALAAHGSVAAMAPAATHGTAAPPHGAPPWNGPGASQQPPAQSQLHAPSGGSMWGNYANRVHTGGSGGGGPTAAGGASNSGNTAAYLASQHDGTRGSRYAPGSSTSGARTAQQPVAAWNGGGAAGGNSVSSQGPMFQPVFSVDTRGCRLLVLDPARSRLLVSESLDGTSCSGIRKISLVSPSSSTFIALPPTAGALYDLQLPVIQSDPTAAAASATPPGRLAAVVTKATGLSLLCTSADNIVGSFSGLPYRPWSCSWVPCAAAPSASGPYGEYLLVAGLEKGHVALLDMRRMDRPVAVMAALQLPLPVRAVAVLPGWTAPTAGPQSVEAAGREQEQPGQEQEATAHGGVLWPPCVVACAKGAWLLSGPSTGGGGAAAVPGVTRLDSSGAGSADGGGGMQLESMCVQLWGGREGGAGGAGGGPSLPWRVALSWRPGASRGSGVGAAAGPAWNVPRHDVGIVRQYEQAPYVHQASLAGHTRQGIQAVRSCFIPPPPSPSSATTAATASSSSSQYRPDPPLLLASADDDTRQPLIWSLPCSGRSSGTSLDAGSGSSYGAGTGFGPGGGGGGGGTSQIVQRLEAHPEPPACMVAAPAPGSGGAGWSASGSSSSSFDCFLACGSLSRVVLYRRRMG